jgi:hypothetical protein
MKKMAIEVMIGFLCIPCDVAVEVFYHRGLRLYTIPGAFYAIQASLHHSVLVRVLGVEPRLLRSGRNRLPHAFYPVDS